MKYFSDAQAKKVALPNERDRAKLAREDSEFNTSALVSYKVEDFRFVTENFVM